MLRNGVRRLALNYARGFNERDLAFLGGLRGCVTELDILSRTLKDITLVYSLAETLEGLSMETGADQLDLTRLPRLKYLAIDWCDVAATISAASQLEEMVLLAYQGRDFSDLGEKPVLSKLVLKPARRLESLRGVESFSSLETLQIKLAPKLEDLSGVEGLAGQLRELELEDCRMLSSIVPVASLFGLRFFGASDCGDISSLAPLAALTTLEVVHLWGSTRIGDDDLLPLTRLPNLRELRIQDRRNYRPRASEITLSG